MQHRNGLRGKYGTDVEIFAIAHLMHASMLVYKIDLDVWQRHSLAFVDPNFNDDHDTNGNVHKKS